MSHASIGAGSTRHRAFFIWAAILTLVFGLLFIGVTVLTIGLWLANQNAQIMAMVGIVVFTIGIGYLFKSLIGYLNLGYS